MKRIFTLCVLCASLLTVTAQVPLGSYPDKDSIISAQEAQIRELRQERDKLRHEVDKLRQVIATLTGVKTDTVVAKKDTVVAPAAPEKPTVDLTVSHIYRREVVRKNCFIVITKANFTLSVYEVVGRDTLLAATFPICYGRNKGNKTTKGDGCTPECTMAHPFTIKQIQNSSHWPHDFKDGRGSILAYGPWFMRLDLSQGYPKGHPVAGNTSIGIHGSTNNESSVPGQGSEGCVRLRDKDVATLHDLYAQEGQKVIIFPVDHKPLSFEK
jgi:lipoprotein-anchoring transpeptidase ErfK/SrfK